MPPMKRLRWYGIDLDGTLAEEIWPEPGVGDPIEENIAKMKEVHEAGYKIRIFTSRYWGDYELVRGWLIQHDLVKYIDGIDMGKPLYKKIIDDKAGNASDESWL